MCDLGLGYLPVALASCFLIGLWTSYALAVYFGNVSPVWPYISDTGVDLPQTCIFSFFFNISAFLALVTMFIRFRYIQNAVRDSDPKLRHLSKINMGFGCISTLGFLLVANFPENKMQWVHKTGAVIQFVGGLIFGVIDCRLSLALWPLWNSGAVCVTRTVLVIFSTIFIVCTFVSEIIAWIQWNNGSETPDASWMLYPADDPGYTAHLVSSITEWLMAGFFLAFFLTYVYEFRSFELEVRVHLQPGTVTQPLTKVPPPANENTQLVVSMVRHASWMPTTDAEP